MIAPLFIPWYLLRIVLCLALLGSVGCHRRTERSTALLPASNEVIGWVRTGDIRTFQAADLSKYIDGDAERYLKAGVLAVSTADYRFCDSFDAVVDIYTMGATAGAQEIFESEPAVDAESIRLGDSARLYSQSLVFRQGPHLVRVTAYGDSTETKPAVLELGRGVEQRITQ